MAVFVGLVGFRMFYASLPGMFTLWLSILTAAGRMIAGYGMGRREAASDEDELGTDELARIVFARLVEEEGDPSGDDE